MKVTASIVNWNTEKLLDKCVSSVFEQTKGIDFTVWVFDNCSKDKSREMLEKKFSHAKLIKNSENIGFGKAHNFVFRKTNDEYFAVINSDIEFKNNVLKILCGFLEKNRKAAAVGCLLLNKDNSVQQNISVVPTLMREVTARIPLFANPYCPKKDYSLTQEVENFSGACFVVRRSAIGKNLFDESIFAYAEETDLFYCLKKNGWKIFFDPKAIAVHYGGASSKHAEKHALYFKGLNYFFRKNYGVLQSFALRTITLFSALVKLVFAIITLNKGDLAFCKRIIKECLVG